MVNDGKLYEMDPFRAIVGGECAVCGLFFRVGDLIYPDNEERYWNDENVEFVHEACVETRVNKPGKTQPEGSKTRVLTCPNCKGEGVYVSYRAIDGLKDYFTCEPCSGTGMVIDPRDRKRLMPVVEAPKRKWRKQ